MQLEASQHFGPTPAHSLWKPEENYASPRILARIQAFLYVAKKYNRLPLLRTVAEQILNKLKDLWPNAKPLDFFPAFSE